MVVLFCPDEFADVRMQILAHRRAVIDHRVDQVLECEFWPLTVPGVKCGGRSETAASTLALDPYAGGIKPELTRVPVQPSKQRVDVLQRRRMRRLWCEAIIDRVDRASQLRREKPISPRPSSRARPPRSRRHGRAQWWAAGCPT